MSNVVENLVARNCSLKYYYVVSVPSLLKRPMHCHKTQMLYGMSHDYAAQFTINSTENTARGPCCVEG